MSSIQKITSFNITNPTILKQNNTRIKPQYQEEFISSPSFKGGIKSSTPNAKKGLAAFFTAALAAIGLIEKEPKTEMELVKKEYKKTKRKNPKFVKNLERTQSYTKAAIVTLAKYKEEDPEFAYELSKILKTYRNTDTFYWNLDDCEYLAQKFKENPNLVKQYNSLGPEESVERLRAIDLAPGFADPLFRIMRSDEVLGYAQIYSKNPQAAMEMSQNKKFHISASDAKIIAEDWDKNKGALDEITEAVKTANENRPYIAYYKDSVVDLINTYHLYPEEVISMIHEGHSPSRISALAEAKAKAPKYYEIALTDLTQNMVQLFKTLEQIREFALNAQTLDKQLTQIAKKRSAGFGIQHSIPFKLSELKSIVEKFKDHPEALDRIIKDGRAKLDIAKLADLYINNPNRIITDNMVKAELDPIGKYFFD